MRLLKRVSLVGVVVTLSGCSTVSNWFHGDDNYRDHEAKLAEQIEMPPNFVVRQTKEAAIMEQALALTQYDDIKALPAYRVEGLNVRSNLVERWLEIEGKTPAEVWQNMRDFLQAQGFDVEEERLDIGMMKTGYVARRDLAPVAQEVGVLTRLLNSWRPELATGVYDRFTLLVETDESKQNSVKVFLRHHMMLADSSGDITEWSVRPYDPMIETLTLYQAMLFFGATQDDAVEQIRAASYYQEIISGEELAGLILGAGLSQSWDYLQAMIYRANWTVKKQNSALYEMDVEVPKLKQTSGFFARLFSSSEQPQVVRLKLSQFEESTEKTLLSLSVDEGDTPLTGERRREVYQALGLLSKP
ncbi:MAG: outer membrane protein assembly factor BamC [Thiomicrospira sp.]|jgi:outer membrane protein assembly factor BamC